MIAPAPVMAALTFPGPILRQLIIQVACRRMRLAIYELRYFQFTSPHGHVHHEKPPREQTRLALHAAALVGGLTAGSAFGAIGFLGFVSFDLDAFDYLLAWLGLSFAAHAFPSYDEARALWVDTNWRLIAPAARRAWRLLAAILFFGAVWKARWIIAVLIMLAALYLLTLVQLG